jgi:hypothetical protein
VQKYLKYEIILPKKDFDRYYAAATANFDRINWSLSKQITDKDRQIETIKADYQQEITAITTEKKIFAVRERKKSY